MMTKYIFTYVIQYFQALPCHLETLDNFDFAISNSNAELSNNVIECLLGKSLAGIVQSREPLRLFLFNTENEEDINLNEAIKEMVIASFTNLDVAFQVSISTKS